MGRGGSEESGWKDMKKFSEQKKKKKKKAEQGALGRICESGHLQGSRKYDGCTSEQQSVWLGAQALGYYSLLLYPVSLCFSLPFGNGCDRFLPMC